MHTRMVKAYGPEAAIKSFDELVPIGTPCEVRGVKTRTWSYGGLGRHNRPCVFVEAFQEPVFFEELKIPGLELVPQRQKSR